MSYAKPFIKKFIKFLYYATGWRRPAKGVVVLCYHSIGDGDNRMVLGTKQFTRQIEWLKSKGVNILTPVQITGFLNGAQLPPGNNCLITFDDGLKDNYTNAFPVLSRLKVPFVIFLTTGHVGGRADWFADKARKYLKVNLEKPLEELTTAQLKAIRSTDFVKEKMDYLIAVSDREAKEFILSLPQLFSQKMLSWEDVEAMAEGGYAYFGSHTSTHPHMSDLDLGAMLQELRVSKAEIEAVTGTECNLFCYPYCDLSDEVKKALSMTGFEAAFVGGAAPTEDFSDRFELNRVQVDGIVPLWEFKMYFSSGFNRYNALLKRLRGQ